MLAMADGIKPIYSGLFVSRRVETSAITLAICFHDLIIMLKLSLLRMQ
jgi:hypothetical protein